MDYGKAMCSFSHQRYNYFNNNAEVLQLTGKDGLPHSYIWDYSGVYPVAECVNADTSSIAYTSFEADGKGNWAFSGTPLFDAAAPTGKKVYGLTTGNITKDYLSSSIVYLVTYWSNNGQKFVSGTTSVTTGRTLNGWTYYEHTVPNPSPTVITISGTGAIDELRLYPVGALMTTYTYQPLVGMTSQADANNKTAYYKYDQFNRLALILDQDKNIVKKICYNYAGQTENCNSYYNVVKTGKALRNNCPGGSTPDSTTYTVPVGTYISSISQNYADSLAQADVNANKQAYANANGVCVCNSCSGEGKKCINGVCETGYKVYTESVWSSKFHVYICTYHYEWSDGTWSGDYTEQDASPCAVE
jgi:hypothetical protein